MKRHTTSTNEHRTDDITVAMILDKSGSMDCVREAVIDGYNAYLKDLRDSGRATGSRSWFSLTLFDTDFRHTWTAKPLCDVPPLDHLHYAPGGMTALYDAIAHTVHKTDHQLARDGNESAKVLVVVLTDGEENSSREYNAGRLAQLVARYEARGNWTFVYLGAGHATLEEARLEAERVGIRRENAMRWRAEDASTRASMEMLSQATVVRRGAAAARTDTFFTDAGQTADDYAAMEPTNEAASRLTRRPLRDTLAARPNQRTT